MATMWTDAFLLLFVLYCSFPPGLSEGGINHHHHHHVTDPCKDLKMDTACLHFQYVGQGNVSLWTQSDVCWQCPLLPRISTRQTLNSTVIAIDTAYSTQLAIYDQSNTSVCNINHTNNGWYHFKEYGSYQLMIQLKATGQSKDNGTYSCNLIITDEDEWEMSLPIIVAFLLYLTLGLAYILVMFLYRKQYLYRILFCVTTEHLVESDLGAPTSINPTDGNKNNEKKSSKRLKSLDTFRGICIVVMIFVNYGGGKYWFFRHSRWNGLTVADLVFPWFVFIMGTTMAISFKSLLRKSATKWQIFRKICQRSLTLFFLGLMVNSIGGYTDMATFRIPGVLQRFAFTYFVVALLQLLFAQSSDPNQYKWWAPIRDIIDYWPEWLANTVVVTTYLVLTYGVSVPDYNCPKGYVGPGGLHKNDLYQNCTGGMAAYIDRQLFGTSHIYQHPTCKKIYNTTVPYDPEGTLGTLMSIFICFLGLQAGKILIIYQNGWGRVKRWLIWSVILGVLAMILTKCKQNEGWIPINKNIWSLSFVLALAAMAFLLLSFCYVTIDMYGWWSGAPFFFPGMNSIFLYFCHEVFHDMFPIAIKVASTHAAQLTMDLWGTTFWVLVSIYMYYKKIFISV